MPGAVKAEALAAPGWALGAYVCACAYLAASRAAFALGDGTVRLESEGGLLQSVATHDGAILAMAADPDRQRLIVGGDDGRLCRIERTLAVVELARWPGRWIEALAIEPRSGLLAAAVGRDIHLLDAVGERIAVIGPHPSTVAAVAFSPDGSRVAAAHYGGASIWSVRNRGAPRRLSWKGSHIALAYSPNAKFLATATQENALHVWRLASGQNMQMAGYAAKIRSLGWTADSSLLTSSGTDTATCWSFAGKGPEGQPPLEFGRFDGLVTAVVPHPTLPFLALGLETGAVILADVARRQTVELGQAHAGAVTCLAWSPDGWRLATGTEAGSARLFPLKDQILTMLAIVRDAHGGFCSRSTGLGKGQQP